ncbi:hypothetical protein MM239_17390 [Belliella sp. DSM 111904]|uniref:CcmD family protein n=1 Tax=Belliella filtrata TaxID=2923435 RepID=A0ABS9V4N4_9BACT|nr:hypothetical protein [Belliella filtrata]MCH7411174.1 hypothetical protein [Belliella filtrata]
MKKIMSLTTSFIFYLCFASLNVFAQNQPDIPKPRGPIDFSQTSNIVIFIIIPTIIIIAFIIFRGRIKKIKGENEESRKD